MGESLFLVSTSILWPQFISPLDVLLQRPTANSFSQPGCHLPWRVIHLDSSKTKLPKPSADPTVYVVNQQPISKTPKSRKKPGKKRRIVLRKRAAAEKAKKEAEAEKRTRRNREKKIKRRQRERERKVALAAAAAAATNGEGSAPANASIDKEGDNASEVDRGD